LQVLIAGLRLVDARLDFSDASLPLPFSARIHDLAGAIDVLASEGNAASTLDFEGQVDEYGLVRIDGTTRALAFDAQSDVTMRFENLEMPRFSPYVIAFAGRQIADGRLDLDLEYHIADGQLEGANAIVMRDLRLGERVEHPDAMSLPLDLAVALLKDANGVIDVDLPVEGDINDPQFSYGGVIWKAVVNLITGIVTAPFRLLGNLVGAGSDDFDAILFEPGRADVAPPEREKLVKLAAALVQRPDLGVEVPGVVWPEQDGAALAAATVSDQVEAELGMPIEQAGADDRLAALERLYEAGDRQPPLQALRTAHSTPDDSGSAVLETVAYAGAVRAALEDGVIVGGDELDALARARAQAVAGLLLEQEGLGAGRVVETGPVQATAEADLDRIELRLGVSVPGD
jgi:hypothetical protein